MLPAWGARAALGVAKQIMRISEHILRGSFRLASKILYGSDMHVDWAYERMQRFGTCASLAGNLALFYSGRPRIYRIISVVIEPVFGCNLRCKTCWGTLPLEGLRPHLMPWDLYRKVIDQIPGYVETVTFSLLGEPLLHPQLPEMIDYAADSGKRPILFTNGTLLKDERLAAIAQTKLAVLNVSVEVDQAEGRRVRGIDQAQIRENVRAFAEATNGKVQVKLSLTAHEGNVTKVGQVADDWGELITGMKVSPMISFNGTMQPRLCMEPWRGNINVFTNGVVSPCCVDCWSSLKIGNVNEQRLEEILHGQAYRDLLARFLAGSVPDTCARCTEFVDPRIPKRAPRRAIGKSRATSAETTPGGES